MKYFKVTISQRYSFLFIKYFKEDNFTGIKENATNMKHQKALFCVLLALFIHANDASRILGIFPYNGKSHFKMFDVLCRELAKRGHQVDVIGHFPLKTPLANYTDVVDLNGTLKTVVNGLTTDYGKQIQRSITYYVATVFGNDLCDLMKQEKMQKFIKNPPNDPPYDLIIVEVNIFKIKSNFDLSCLSSRTKVFKT